MSANPDIVYVLRDGENEELRYSLRSLEKNFKGINRVWFYGGKPSWLKSKNYVLVKQTGSKWQNTSTLYRNIVDNEDISEDFILMNDDFFILRPMQTLDYFYEGGLDKRVKRTIAKDVWGRNQQSRYGQLLQEANTWLKQNGYSNYNYEVHCPMTFNRHKLYKILEMFPAYGVGARRSLYGNIWRVGGQNLSRDCKLYPVDLIPSDIEEWQFLSTTDISFRGKVGDYIKTRFTEKSEWE